MANQRKILEREIEILKRNGRRFKTLIKSEEHQIKALIEHEQTNPNIFSESDQSNIKLDDIKRIVQERAETARQLRLCIQAVKCSNALCDKTLELYNL